MLTTYSLHKIFFAFFFITLIDQYIYIILTIIFAIMSITRSSFRQQQQPSVDFKEQVKKYSFYIMIDPLCGLGCGKVFLKLETEQICFLLDSDGDSDRLSDKEKKFKYDVHLNFCNLTNQKSVQSTFDCLKKNMVEKYRKNRIIVCGNESSLNDLLVLSQKYNIQINKIPIGLIPSGLNNDLSNTLGWGDIENSDLIDLQLKFIKNLVRKWIRAIVQKIDIWKIQVEVDEEEGQIQKVNKNTQLKYTEKQKILNQYMISHLNIGVHARIALGFDQNKSKQSSFANKLIYAFQGVKKMMCMKPLKVQKMISVVEICSKNDLGNQKIFKTLFSAKKIEEEQNQRNQHKYIKGSPVNLVCLNISCYRGVPNIWGNAISGIDVDQQNQYTSQSYYDGKLEFVTFDSSLSSEAKKICQTEGSIKIKMQRLYPTYLQIDDSAYKLNNPKEIRISRHSKLQILINSESLK